MQIGDFFNGRYVIEKILGQGGMGTVYLARNINTETFWAIKEISRREDLGIDLMAEPKLLKKLDHPALPVLFDILEQDGKLYLISDYINGISLDQKLAAEGKIAEEIVVDWAIQLCKALDYLHTLEPNPIIYRDMKPSNIILAANGVLKLIDFGIAREYKVENDTDTVYIGTRGYAAPEQYGAGQTSAVSDIYSLGITLHQLLTGKSPSEQPHGLKSVRFYDASISAELESIILKCTCDNPDERYQSAAELLAELEHLKKTSDAEPEIHNHSFGAGHSFRRLVLSIWDNAEFGCELAYMAAKYTNGEVLLVDLDLLAPKADLFMGIGKYSVKSSHADIYVHSRLDAVLDAAGKGILTAGLIKQASVTRKDLKNLHIITGNYRLDNYEYYSEDSVSKLIDKCYRTCDITILLVNRFIYDAFTLAALLRSDINIAAVRGDVDQLREFNNYIAFLEEKQRLPAGNTQFVLFNYDKTTGIGMDEARAATRGNLLCAVSASKKRAMYRSARSEYITHMEKEVVEDYINLLKRLGLLPDPGPLHRLRALAGRLCGDARPDMNPDFGGEM
jgi:serine/threonine protein kinase